MNICVIGFGSIGQRHVRNLLTLGVAATDIHVFDPNREAVRLAPSGVHQHQMDAGFTGVGQNNFVLICSPAITHARYIRTCLAMRTPFFVEKPATLGVTELTPDQWDTDVPHVVGYNWRWHMGYKRLATLARGARLLRLLCDTNMAAWPGSSYADAVSECSHDLDLAVQWCGPVWQVEVRENRGTVCIYLVHDSGQRSSVILDTKASTPARRGMVDSVDEYFDGDLGRLLDNSYVNVLAHFLHVARGIEQSQSTLFEARNVVSLCETVNDLLSRQEAVAQ